MYLSKCRKAYWGYNSLPGCPACGFDCREREELRWDVLVYLLWIVGAIGVLLVSYSCRNFVHWNSAQAVPGAGRDDLENLSDSKQVTAFHSPYTSCGESVKGSHVNSRP